MNYSYKAEKLIRFREACVLFAYDDSTGKAPVNGVFKGNPTIGWGHLITSADKYMLAKGFKLTQRQADDLHAKDMQQKAKEVTSYLKVRVSQDTFDALVSFAFNYSPKWVKQITDKLNSGRPLEYVANMFMERSKSVKFLQKCRYADAMLMLKGLVINPENVKLS
ncbi:lysozyme [Pedobacter sp. PAMC26386]|nr:lysozyme [Pedobacter sp. PAMC26386]